MGQEQQGLRLYLFAGPSGEGAELRFVPLLVMGILTI